MTTYMDTSTPLSLWAVVLIGLALGSLSAYFAKKRGRDPMVWFMLGALFGLLGLILLLILPQLKEKESNAAVRPEDELYKQSFETQVKVTDDHSGLIDLSLRECKSKEWFYLDDAHETKGPVTFSDLKELWEKSKINESSLVWYEGLKDWRPISSFTCLAELLSETEPEYPPDLD